jgi:hypothetical protein
MTSATLERPGTTSPAATISLADALVAMRGHNAELMAKLTIATVTVDGIDYQYIAPADGVSTGILRGRKSRGNGFKETDAHKTIRALAAQKGPGWFILQPPAPVLNDQGIMTVRRPEAALNRAYADLAGVGELKARPAKGKLITAEPALVPSSVRKLLPPCPSRDDVAAALADNGPILNELSKDADAATVATYNAHQELRAEAICIVTKWY